jgi:hypothetical protein
MKPFIIVLIATLFCGVSCSVSIPATDSTPPEITFTISGPGVRGTIRNQAEADAKQFNLKYGEVYTITCVMGDRGGMNRSIVSMGLRPTDATFNVFTDQSNSVITPTTATFQRYTILGNTSRPISTFLTRGTFSINNPGQGNLISFDITLQAADFGGRAATVNNTTLSIHCLGDIEGRVITL